MRIKLVFLPSSHADPNLREEAGEIGFPPLGIATLAAFLRSHGIRVKQDDLDTKVFFHNQKFHSSKEFINLSLFLDEKRLKNIKKGEEVLEKEGEKILKLTSFKGFDVIGFSLRSADNPSVVGVAVTLAKLLKEKYGTLIIAGGVMSDSTIKQLLESRFIDYVIYSSHVGSFGEINLLKFCEMYEKGGNLLETPGIIYLKEGKLVYTRRYEEEYRKEERCIFTLPDFKGLPMKLYEYKVTLHTNGEKTAKILTLPYFFIYGCPNRCAFCHYSRFPLMGTKKPEEVAKDLEILSTKYKTRYFYFLNTEINVTKKYAEMVADEIIKGGVDVLWTDCATFKNMDINLLKKLKKAGAARFVWGLESASPRILNYIEKGVTPRQAEIILKKCYELKIWSNILLICGFPYERTEDINTTISFLQKNLKYIGGAVVNKFWIDGLFNDIPEKYGIRIKEEIKAFRDWSTKPFEETKGLSWEKRAKLTLKHFEMLQRFLKEKRIFGERPIHAIFHLIDLSGSDSFSFKNRWKIEKSGRSYIIRESLESFK